MGLTYDQAQALGIGHLHPAASGGKSPERAFLDDVLDQLGPAPPKSRAPEDGMSKLERGFLADVLEPALFRADITGYRREPIKFRLAGRTWFTPDFQVWQGQRIVFAGGQAIQESPLKITFVEIKGFMRDDAAVKLKVAASLYPEFHWLLITRPTRRDGWQVRRVTRTGISRETVSIDWIPGS